MARQRTDLPLISAGSGNRHPRYFLVITMSIVLAVVLFVVFKILPDSPGRRARPHVQNGAYQEALALEKQSLDRAAADRYRQIVDSTDLKPEVRYDAALRLARLAQTRLAERATAESALEQAWLLAPDDDARAALAARIAALRGYPVAPAEAPPVSARMLLPSDYAADAQTKAGRTVVARIGDEAVTFEDLMYAWSQSHGSQPPTPEAFEPFVTNYLNMLLLADEAQRLGLDQKGRTQLDLRLNRVLDLSKAMTELMIKRIPQPTEAQLRAFYQANQSQWRPPARAEIGAIAVADADHSAAVGKALADGDSFADVAEKYSTARHDLEDGYKVGEVAENMQTVPHIGPQPGLAPFLTGLKDDETTGPIRLASGYYWFKMLKKNPPEPPVPFEQVRDQVNYQYQATQLAQMRSELLKQLRAVRPITIREAALTGAMQTASASTTASATQTAGAPPRTPSEPTSAGLPPSETLP